MLRILIKKLSVCFTGLIILITCTACEANASYPIRDYLNDLSIASGIGTGMDIDENFEDLYAWGITDRSDRELFDKKLDYDYLSKTIGRLIEADGDYLTVLKCFALFFFLLYFLKVKLPQRILPSLMLHM